MLGMKKKRTESVPLTPEAQRRQNNLYAVTAVTVSVDIGFGVYFVLSHQLPYMSALLLTNAVLQLGNLLVYRRLRKIDGANFFLTAGGTIIISSLLFTSIGGTAIYWVAMYAPTVFVSNGYKNGLRLNAIFFSLCTLIIGARIFGLVETPYTVFQHLMGYFASLVMFSMALSGERAQDGFRRQIEAQRERLNDIVRELPVGIMVFDAPGGKLSVSNDTAAGLLQRPVPPGIAASSFASEFGFTKEDGAPLGKDGLPAVVTLKKGVAASANLYAGDANHRRVLRAVSAPVRGADGKQDSAVLVLEDETKRYEVDKMKSEFVSLASHQLKTPLTGVAWAVESLLDPATGPLNEEQ
ncbi:MAG: hypothetical protein RLZZ324_716, partial [Candidatus Parcubacteria bacterium]